MTGVKSVNFDQASFVDEIIGHRDGSLVRAPASLVRAQFAAEPLGPNCQNRADLYADLAWADGATATVWGDATEAWRGVYRKSGASGAGSWARIGDLPMSSATSAQLNAKADAAVVAAALDGKATAAQGAKADTAVQPGADVSVLVETADAKILTAAERTKLAGIAPAATANASDAALRDRASHTGAQPIATVTGLQAALDGKATAAQGARADTAVQPGADVSVLAETADAKILTAAERTKLAGIAPAATANASDAALRDRASHTGAQPIATVSGLQAALDGKATAAQGAKADTALQPGAALSQMVETADAKILTAAERTKLAGIAPAATANASDTALRDRASHTGAQPIATVTGLQAALDGKATAAQGAKADTAVQPAALAAEEARARAAEALIASGQRPGDLASAYAPELTGAVASTTAYDASAAVVDGDLGAAIRLTTATHVAPRAPLAIEPGRIYQARWVTRRLTDPTDPSGDAVEIGIRWLTEAQTGVAGGAGNRVVETMPLTVAMGVQRRAATFSADVAGTDYPIPAAARYGRPWLRSYGVDHVTLAGRVELVDITEAWLADRAAAAAVQPADIAPDLAKLAGIAPGATANASDAALRDRASHTGAQPITSVTGLSDSLAGLAQARIDGDAAEAVARAAEVAARKALVDAPADYQGDRLAQFVDGDLNELGHIDMRAAWHILLDRLRRADGMEVEAYAYNGPERLMVADEGGNVLFDSLALPDVLATGGGIEIALYDYNGPAEAVIADEEGNILGVIGEDNPSAAIALRVSDLEAELAAARGGAADLAARLAPAISAEGALRLPRINRDTMRQMRLRQARLRRGVAVQIDHAICGDSFSHAWSRWSGPFATEMVARLGDGGGGWTGYGYQSPYSGPYVIGGSQPGLINGNARPDLYPVRYSGAWDRVTLGPGPDTHHVTAPAGAFIQRQVPATPDHTGLRLIWIATADGVVRWRVDGGAWSPLNVQGPEDTIQSAVLPLTAGAHVIEIEVVSGTVKLCGDNALSDAPGYRCHKIARSGSRVSQWIAQDEAQQRAAWELLGVNVWTLMEATNSQTTPGETAPADWRDMMRIMVARMRAASVAADVVLFQPPDNQRPDNAYPMTAYADAARDLAQELGVAFLDAQPAFGADRMAYGHGSDFPLFSADLLHPDPETGGAQLTSLALEFHDFIN